MAAFRLILFTVLATVWFSSTANAAAVHNLIYADELTDANDNGDRAESYTAFLDSIRARRSRRSEERHCHNTVPCGWAVYVPFSREMNYFMRNTCSCAASSKCIKMEDDLSVGAYVYRCGSNFTAQDTEWPHA